LETFRAQTARVENEIKDLQEKNFEMDIKVQSLEHDKLDLMEELKNSELEITKSKLKVEKMRNEIDTLKLFERKIDEVSGDCKDLNLRLLQSKSQNEKDTLNISELKRNLYTADLECKELRNKNNDLNNALDVHDEHKL
jgi:chromosome segregation ATPase